MKQALLILFAVISINCYSQTKKDSSQKANSVKVDSLTRDTKFLSIGDIYRVSEKFKDQATFNQYSAFLQLLEATLNELVKEYYGKTTNGKASGK